MILSALHSKTVQPSLITLQLCSASVLDCGPGWIQHVYDNIVTKVPTIFPLQMMDQDPENPVVERPSDRMPRKFVITRCWHHSPVDLFKLGEEAVSVLFPSYSKSPQYLPEDQPVG
jgi:hypothetical protein